ncbi:ABC transporter ATP-binding protein [Salinibacterium sp. M195]|uniref:ABC transporter ATP-binding protein n=1 Tax=Salinibacterium sp. M195 TaxID=2583374 RepID=UPI001C6394BF|nr:ATP-binding cassette domain-containing protein [Salinibacterium sp. M195]QYH35095.1 ABC transporter ATP-binding protein [Salinibacterium sp. M195]
MTTATEVPQVETLQLVDGGMNFDGVQALEDVSISVKSGEVVGLIGPNGSGKTTTLNLVSGMLHPTTGRVMLGDKDLTRMSMRKRARIGIVRTFQSVRVFGRLTVAENIEVAALGCGMRRHEARELTEELLEELNLESVANTAAESSPAGLIRTIGIARALATRPKFLLLDEPAAGQNESEAVELIEAIRNISRRRACGVLLVEHDMSVVMSTCDRLHVLDSGRTVIAGLPQDIRHDPQVVEIYFGKRH